MKNTKKERVNFANYIDNYLTKLSTKKVVKKAENRTAYEIETKSNIFVFILYPEDHHKNLFTVFGRFETPCKNIGNPYSGKHNFHNVHSLSFAKIDFAQHVIEILNQ